MSTLHNILTKFGLSDADAKVYLMLDNAGESDIATMMDSTGLSRTAIYDTITKLTEKKLLEHRKVGKTAYYNITHPQHLEALLIEKKQADAELEHAMQQSIQELTKTYNVVSDQPGIYFFPGKENIIKMYNSFFQDDEPVDSIEEEGQMLKFLGDYCYEYIAKRIQHRMYNRCIAPQTNTLNSSDSKQLREGRLISPAVFPFRMDIKMAGSKTILVTFNNNKALGVMIDNPEITENFKILFNFLWMMLDQTKLSGLQPKKLP